MTTSPLCSGDCAACFYCDMPLSPRHEHDHFPMPSRSGGEATVPACINCHDLKDRVAMKDWHQSVLVDAVAQAGPLGRVLLAKLSSLMSDYEAAAEERAA